jgi:hypothetical protein
VRRATAKGAASAPRRPAATRGSAASPAGATSTSRRTRAGRAASRIAMAPPMECPTRFVGRGDARLLKPGRRPPRGSRAWRGGYVVGGRARATLWRSALALCRSAPLCAALPPCRSAARRLWRCAALTAASREGSERWSGHERLRGRCRCTLVAFVGYIPTSPTSVPRESANAPAPATKGELSGHSPTNSPLVLPTSANAPEKAASGGTPSPR